MKLTNNNIKNGPLYFNVKQGKVQRVIGNLNSRRVWTQRRKKAPEATSISNLRLATNDEVEAYLDKSEALATA
jgi:hypothetical protein|tara:strand:- start:295 stop:513 length:219 start_codon:yes stop_codon:yes gene_type:complete